MLASIQLTQFIVKLLKLHLLSTSVHDDLGIEWNLVNEVSHKSTDCEIRFQLKPQQWVAMPGLYQVTWQFSMQEGSI